MGSIVLLVANAVLVLVLVGPLGLIGPALGTVLATTVLVAYYLVRLRSVLGMTIRALFPWPLLAAHLAISALAGVPVALLLLAGLDGPLLLVVAAVLYAPSYLGLLLAARRLEPAEVEPLRRALDAARNVVRGRLRPRSHGRSA